MTTHYQEIQESLRKKPSTWLVTGVAGFIGSNLLEKLLILNQRVIGLDNFATGSRANLDDVQAVVGNSIWKNFTLIEGDISSSEDCLHALSVGSDQVDYVLHQAALGSVPRSIRSPELYLRANIDGFFYMLNQARLSKVQRFVFASSSSVYGDSPDLPKLEGKTGNPLSPYALSKKFNEQCADLYARTYDMHCVGLRYFNVFGRRQSPDGEYAAVIPRWVAALMNGETVVINGDGETSRDFCYIENVVQANILAAVCLPALLEGEKGNASSLFSVYNVAYGARTTLNELYKLLHDGLLALPNAKTFKVEQTKLQYGPFRDGDIRHSLANTTFARRSLGYLPTHSVEQGLAEALIWYAS